jgi:hypothetical protein
MNGIAGAHMLRAGNTCCCRGSMQTVWPRLKLDGFPAPFCRALLNHIESRVCTFTKFIPQGPSLFLRTLGLSSRPLSVDLSRPRSILSHDSCVVLKDPSFGLGQWNGEFEDTALTRPLTLRPDVAPMKLHHPACQRQAQSGTFAL